MAEQLVETPTAELDQLALVTEVLAKRQEEAADARTQLSTLRHQIQQERIHWEEQRRQEEQAIRNQRLALEQEIAEKRGEIDAVVRAQTDVLMQKDTERQAAVKERLIAQEERRQLGDLNRERVEVERFRTEVTRRHQESEARSIEAQAMLNTASQRHEKATPQPTQEGRLKRPRGVSPGTGTRLGFASQAPQRGSGNDWAACGETPCAGNSNARPSASRT